MSDGRSEALKVSSLSGPVEFGIMKVIGYASIEEAEFDWGLKGLNIIQAPNGTGKTQFINALFWALFGKTLKGSVETWEHAKPKGYKGTMVEVNFTRGDHVQVIRCKDYTGKIDGASGKNRLIIKVNGEEPKKVRDKKEYQQWLENRIGYSSELFKNSIIFGQKLKRLITETGPNKKKIFDEAFEVEYIPKARKIIDEEKKVALTNFSNQQRVTDKLGQQVNTLNEKLKREQEVENTFENTKLDNITREMTALVELKMKSRAQKELLRQTKFIDIDKAINLTNESIKKQTENLKNLNEKALNDKKSHWGYQKETAQKDQKTLRNNIDKLNQAIVNIPLKCDQCGKPFNVAEKSREKKRLQELRSLEIQALNTKLEFIGNCTGYITEVDTALSSVLELHNAIELLENSLDALDVLKKEQDEINAELVRMAEQKEKHKQSIAFFNAQKLQTNISQVTEELHKVEAKYLVEKKTLRKYHKDWKIKDWLMNDPLSNAGLKAFIFDQMLDSINDRLDYYSKFIGFQVVFDINMASVNKDLNTYVYMGDNPVPYEDLSGGQQQSVDVATAFAIHDVVNEGRECTLLVMDEIFESLDKNNIEIVAELVQDKVKGKCLYLITHRAEFAPTNANIIMVYNHNGITSLN